MCGLYVARPRARIQEKKKSSRGRETKTDAHICRHIDNRETVTRIKIEKGRRTARGAFRPVLLLSLYTSSFVFIRQPFAYSDSKESRRRSDLLYTYTRIYNRLPACVCVYSRGISRPCLPKRERENDFSTKLLDPRESFLDFSSGRSRRGRTRGPKGPKNNVGWRGESRV